jgi:hypothetical protein
MVTDIVADGSPLARSPSLTWPDILKPRNGVCGVTAWYVFTQTEPALTVCKSQRLVYVVGHDASDQAIEGVVSAFWDHKKLDASGSSESLDEISGTRSPICSFVHGIKLQDGLYGCEDFLPRDTHVVGDSGKHRGLDVIALLESRTQVWRRLSCHYRLDPISS